MVNPANKPGLTGHLNIDLEKQVTEIDERVIIIEQSPSGSGTLKRTINMSTAEIGGGSATVSSKEGAALPLGAVLVGHRMIVNEGISGGSVSGLGYFAGTAAQGASFISGGVVGSFVLTTPGSQNTGINDGQNDMGGIVPRLEINASNNLNNITAGDVTFEIMYLDMDDAVEGA